MKRFGMLLGIGLALGAMTLGCQSQDPSQQVSTEHGTISLPLKTQGPSGTIYRLRDASFQISGNSYDDPYGYGKPVPGVTGVDYGGTGVSTGGSPSSYGNGYFSTQVSSEDEPDAASVSVSLEQGRYEVYLQPGWRLEKVTNGVAEPVTATLIGSNVQYAWVSPHSTSSVAFQFGVGGRSIWLNGKLNVDIQVYENPDEIYGGPVDPKGNILTPDVLESGWIGGDPQLSTDNPAGIQGAISLFGDNITCSPPVASSGCGPKGCCLDYATIADPTFASWGCGIQVALNATGDSVAGAGDSKYLPYMGPATGLRITYTNAGTGLVRADYSQLDPMPPLEISPYIDAPTKGGTLDVVFKKVVCPSWPGTTCTPPTANPYTFQLQVRGGEGKTSGRLCITSIEPIL